MDISVEIVREILGSLSDLITDDQIESGAMEAAIKAEISRICPKWLEITDPDDLETLNMAVAYMVASRLIASAGGIGGEVRSISLGDQSTTYAEGYLASSANEWMRDAKRMIGTVCPVVVKPALNNAVFFTTARGKRGR